MADPDKPLHVRVAECLGWTECDPNAKSSPWEFHDPPMERIQVGLGIPPGERHRRGLPHYDTDWLETGPLIEKYKITVAHYPRGDDDSDYFKRTWWAFSVFGVYSGEAGSEDYRLDSTGESPLIAVCHLIIALGAAGKLK